jgi:hypothetical protein
MRKQVSLSLIFLSLLIWCDSAQARAKKPAKNWFSEYSIALPTSVNNVPVKSGAWQSPVDFTIRPGDVYLGACFTVPNGETPQTIVPALWSFTFTQNGKKSAPRVYAARVAGAVIFGSTDIRFNVVVPPNYGSVYCSVRRNSLVGL